MLPQKWTLSLVMMDDSAPTREKLFKTYKNMLPRVVAEVCGETYCKNKF